MSIRVRGFLSIAVFCGSGSVLCHYYFSTIFADFFVYLFYVVLNSYFTTTILPYYYSAVTSISLCLYERYVAVDRRFTVTVLLLLLLITLYVYFLGLCHPLYLFFFIYLIWIPFLHPTGSFLFNSDFVDRGGRSVAERQGWLKEWMGGVLICWSLNHGVQPSKTMVAVLPLFCFSPFIFVLCGRRSALCCCYSTIASTCYLSYLTFLVFLPPFIFIFLFFT